jgi:hypothetical protein
MTLQATEFIRRFLLHVLPRFVKICHFGFLANRRREDSIRLCRTLLDAQSPNVRDAAVTRQEQPNSPDRCPLCNEACGRSRFFCRRPWLSPAPRFRYFDAIPHEAAPATNFPPGCLRDSRSCMETFAPECQIGIEHICCAAVPTLQAQLGCIAGPPKKQIIAIQIP